MKTHLVYSRYGKRKLYFCGVYTGEVTAHGFCDITWDWSFDRNEASLFLTTDAWDLLHLARYTWPKATIEIERVYSYGNQNCLDYK